MSRSFAINPVTDPCDKTYPATSQSSPVFGRSSSTQNGLGKHRASKTRSASVGTPYLKPNDIQLTAILPPAELLTIAVSLSLS
jgi:hypothetical protein